MNNINLGQSFEKFKIMISEKTASELLIKYQALMEILERQKFFHQEVFDEAKKLIEQARKELFNFPGQPIKN